MTSRSFYKMRDITKALNISARTVRYYDQFGLLPHVKRSAGNTRVFDDADIRLLKTIRRMQKKDLLPLHEIKSRLFKSTADGVRPNRMLLVIGDPGSQDTGVALKPMCFAITQQDVDQALGACVTSGVEAVYCLCAKDAGITVSHPALDIQLYDCDISGPALFTLSLAFDQALEAGESHDLLDDLFHKLHHQSLQLSLFGLASFTATTRRDSPELDRLRHRLATCFVLVEDAYLRKTDVLGSYISEEDAFLALSDHLGKHLNQRARKVDHVVIRYCGRAREAQRLATRIQGQSPDSVIVMDESDASNGDDVLRVCIL